MRLFRLSPDGAEKVIEIVAPGQTFAEAVMLLNAPRYPVCVEALCGAELLSIDARDFCGHAARARGHLLRALGDLSRRLRGLIGEIDNLTLYTATSRVARVEKNLSDQGIIEVQGSHVTIVDQAALEEIAKLGDSLELTPTPCTPAVRPIRKG